MNEPASMPGRSAMIEEFLMRKFISMPGQPTMTEESTMNDEPVTANGPIAPVLGPEVQGTEKVDDIEGLVQEGDKSGQSTVEPEFIRFPLLPVEIRLKIWRCTFPPPKELQLEIKNPHIEPEEESEHIRENEWVPVALLVNVESREEALKVYKPFAHKANELGAIHTRLDSADKVIWLQSGYDALRINYFQLMEYPATFTQWFDGDFQTQIPTFFSSIRRVSVTHMKFYNNPIVQKGGINYQKVYMFTLLLLQFTSLRKCSFVEIDQEVLFPEYRMEVLGNCLEMEREAGEFFQRNVKRFPGGVPEVRLLRFEEFERGICFRPIKWPNAGWKEKNRAYRKFWTRDEEGLEASSEADDSDGGL